MGAVMQLFRTLEHILPKEVLIVLVVLFAIVGAPSFLFNVKSRQIRSAVRNVARATTKTQRETCEDAALAIAGGQRRAIVVVGDEAARLNQRGLYEKVLKRLINDPAAAADVRRLRSQMEAPKPPPLADSIEAVVLIRRLIAEDLLEQATVRLTEALARHPGDPSLKELEIELERKLSSEGGEQA